MKILADGSLPDLHKAFPSPFSITTYKNNQEIPALLPGNDILLCRSTLTVDKAMLGDYPLKYLATASSGIDHVDQNYLMQQNIKLIDAKGCNAISVADYVMANLAWLETHNLVKGKKAGIVGLGMVGSRLYERLLQLGFQIVCYDPPKELSTTSFRSCSFEALFQCDVLCIHAALHQEAPYSTHHLLDEYFFEHLKPHCIVINAARGGIIKEEALLTCQKPFIYCTDVYSNEPHMNPQLIERSTLCTPHIAGHCKEAKFAAVAMISNKIHNLLGLSVPHFSEFVSKSNVTLTKESPWQKHLLSFYNPAFETTCLKQAMDKKEAFLALREQHSRKHWHYSVDFLSSPLENFVE